MLYIFQRKREMVQSDFSFRTPLYSTSFPVKKGKKSWKRGCSLLRTLISYVPTKLSPISWQRRALCHHWCWRTSHLLLHRSEETAVWQSCFLTTWIQWSGQHTPPGSCVSWQKQWRFHCLFQTPCFHDRFPLFPLFKLVILPFVDDWWLCKHIRNGEKHFL